MNGCIYCRINTAGEHEIDCPLHPSRAKGPIDDFVRDLREKATAQIQFAVVPDDETLIDRYTSLLSSYCMTLDIIEAAPDFLDKKLEAVADFIKNALEKCVNEIIAIQELRGNGK